MKRSLPATMKFLLCSLLMFALAFPIIGTAVAADDGGTEVTTATDTPTAPAAQVAKAVPSPDDGAGYLREVFNAVASKRWMGLAALLLIGVVWVARKYALKRVAFFQTDRGGFILALLLGILGGVSNALAAGASVTPDLLITGIEVGVLSAGGWSGLKRLLGLTKATEPPAAAATAPPLPLKP